MKRSVKITDILKPLDGNSFQIYVSNAIQVADVLEYILNYTGNADVTLTSFSISEEFLRRLFFLRKKGSINSIRIVLDNKATGKTLILWPFIAQTVDLCYLTNNHSKILIVSGLGGGREVAAVMSQNLTRGNRFECAAITTDKSCISNLKVQINEIINNNSIQFNDIYRRTIGED